MSILTKNIYTKSGHLQIYKPQHEKPAQLAHLVFDFFGFFFLKRCCESTPPNRERMAPKRPHSDKSLPTNPTRRRAFSYTIVSAFYQYFTRRELTQLKAHFTIISISDRYIYGWQYTHGVHTDTEMVQQLFQRPY